MIQDKISPKSSTAFFIDVIGIVVIFIVLKELQEIFIPLVIAYFLFFVFAPMNNYLEKRKVPSYLVIILDLLIVIFFLGSISSIIVDSFSRLGEELPTYEAKLNTIVSSTAVSMGIKNPNITNFQVGKFLYNMDYGTVAGDLFTSTFSMIGTVFFVLFFFIFVVTGNRKIYEAIKKRYISMSSPVSSPSASSGDIKISKTETRVEKTEDDKKVVEKKETVHLKVEKESELFLKSTFREITDQIQRYVIGKFFISLAMAIVVGIVLLIFKVDFIIVWAVITFMFNFIPNIGAIITVILPFLMALVQYESFGYASLIALILIVIHNIFGNIIEPKIFGNRLGLNPLVILLSLLLWGYIWGIVGMLLSVPLTALVKIIISRSESPNLVFLSDIMSS